MTHIAGAGPLADYQVGQRVQTKEGFSGRIDDILEGPADLTTYWVTLDNGQGGGEYAEAEIWPVSATKSSAVVVEHTAKDDYPELGTILEDRLPPTITSTATQHEALTFDLSLNHETDTKEVDPEEARGYEDGHRDGKAGVTRNFRDDTPAYRAGYDQGWAFGVQQTRTPPADSFADLQGLDDQQIVGTESLASRTAGIMDFVMGNPPPDKYKGHLSYDWCFSGDTTFMTSEGERTFKEVAGTSQRVLDGRGDWVSAEIRDFGVQPLRKITLVRGRATKEIFATGEHRWFVETKDGREERTTDQLEKSQKLASRLPRSLLHLWRPDPFGVAHGVVFGDGTLTGEMGHEGLRGKPARLNLWGEKDAQLLPYFALCPQKPRQGYTNQLAVGVEVSGLPRAFKDRPSLHEAPSYLYGWLAGYFAADGRVGKNGSNIEISCSDRETLVFVQAVCARLSIATNDIGVSHRKSCSGKGMIHQYRELKYGRCGWCDEGSRRDQFTIGFVGSTLRPEFFLIKEHLERFESAQDRVSRPPNNLDGISWFVRSVEETERVESVYCAVVPTTHSFVLQGNILTGNCRFRKDTHCFYSKNLNVAASEQMGYAVWIPEDRGSCWRSKWEAQMACDMAMPGPNVPGGFTNATIPFEQGGQQGGRSTNTYRSSLAPRLAAEPVDAELGFHLTAAWRDVQAKAKRIREAGGVRIIASRDGVVVGHIRGDHNVYESEIVSVPGKRSVASWNCGCKWGSYSWGRSGPWKKFEGRQCSHSLALMHEVQSRGMFGKEMTLDEGQPAWMDTSIPVRTPGSYDRDKGRYSSLATGRPVHEQDDSSPMVAVASQMMAEGYRYADIKTYAHACGVEDVPSLVREARKTKSFPAKVWGLVKSIFIENGVIHEEGTGREIAAKDVTFPNWDPKKGLDYRPPRTSSASGCGCGGSCGCGGGSGVGSRTASPADVLSKAKDIPQAADLLLTIARDEERSVTPLMQQIASQNRGRLEGLDHRFKGKDSLVRKMTSEAHGKPPAQVAMGMSDALRYTMVLPFDSYTQATKSALSTLKSRGYGERVKNYWGRGDPYNGVNAALTSPDGFPIELQFHTDDTLNIKEKQIHPVYEKWREETDPFKRAKMGTQMRDMMDMAPRPLGALGLSTRKMQETPKWNAWDWIRGTPRAAAVGQPGPYRFIYTDTGQVVRFDIDDSTTEFWDGDGWVLNLDLGRYLFLGEPGFEDLTAAHAHAIIEGVSPYGTDSFQFVPGHSTPRAVQNVAPLQPEEFMPNIIQALRVWAMGYREDLEKVSTLSDAADLILSRGKQYEPDLTKSLQGLAGQHGGRLEGLDFRLKGKDSLMRKMEDWQPQYGSAGAVAGAMSDPLRYTMVVDGKNYGASAKSTVEALKQQGYTADVKNYWKKQESYKGINVAMKNKDGYPVEVQFHTPESLKTKKAVHPLYEQWRTEPDAFKRAKISKQMRTMFDTVPRPLDVLKAGPITSYPKENPKDWDWMTGKPQPGDRKQLPVVGSLVTLSEVGAPGPYRYVQLASGYIARFDTDDSVTEMWKDGAWTHQPFLGSLAFKGEPMGEEISEDEALGITRSNNFSHPSSAPDLSATQETPAHQPAEAPGTPQNIGGDQSNPFKTSVLDDDPEAALPITYGTDDPDEAALAIQSALFTEDDLRQAWATSPEALAGVSPEEALAQVYRDQGVAEEFIQVPVLMTNRLRAVTDAAQAHADSLPRCDVDGEAYHSADPEGEFHTHYTTATKDPDQIVAQMDAFLAGESTINPLAHLGDPKGSQPDNDIQAAAAQFVQKEALKSYTPAERQQFIDEGKDEGVTASNFDKMDITGTHYQALEAAQAKKDAIADVDDAWMLDGDPNGAG